jgi:hypothetical protein
MSRLIVLVVGVALLAGGMMFLASRVSERPVARHEKPVLPDALRK